MLTSLERLFPIMGRSTVVPRSQWRCKAWRPLVTMPNTILSCSRSQQMYNVHSFTGMDFATPLAAFAPGMHVPKV
jgi:hypothetical protein